MNAQPENAAAPQQPEPKQDWLDPKERDERGRFNFGFEDRNIKTPRNFAIEPTGKYMLVANQSGGNVLSFGINQSTGELIPTGSAVSVGSPVCVRFVPLGK
jgi:6-phosphogluconolactonase (cycloisomerase 2 family)